MPRRQARRTGDDVMGRASRFLRGLRSFFPLPSWWIIQRQLEPGGRSLLDIGCGRGGPIEPINEMERIARRQVVISIPVRRCHQQAYGPNPYQAHHSTWLPQGFRRLGYTARGSGLRGMGGLIAQETSPLPEWLRLVANAVWILASPFSYYFPRVGDNMVCVKNIDGEGLKNAS